MHVFVITKKKLEFRISISGSEIKYRVILIYVIRIDIFNDDCLRIKSNYLVTSDFQINLSKRQDVKVTHSFTSINYLYVFLLITLTISFLILIINEV